MIRAEINEIESKKDAKDQWIQELVLWKDKEIDKPLTRLIKKKSERTQINKIRNERGDMTTDTKEIQRTVRKILWTIICQQTGHPRQNG